MITSNQCRAARGLVGLSISDLAEEAGVSKSTIQLFENNKTNTRPDIVNRLARTLEKIGIEFLGKDGVRSKSDKIKLLNGPYPLEELWSDIIETLIEGKREILILNVDEKRTQESGQGDLDKHIKHMKKLGIKERLLSCEGDDYFLMPKEYYRWLPKQIFDAVTSTYIYADKVAWQLWNDNKILLLTNEELAQSEKKRFEYLWHIAQKPQ